VLVLGLARSGKAAAAALERRGVEVVGADRELGNDGDPALLEGIELLVKSPGIPREAALVAEAERRGVPIWSEVEPDRREAIARAIDAAQEGDVVVIAGKGHEQGQQFADRTVPFDDRDVAREALRRLGAPT
jgi:UDP-N-acetylmuramoylalanine-D-glutamate ligase